MVHVATLAALPSLPALPTLSGAEVITAHEISAYHTAGTPLNEEITIAVQFIVDHYPRPVPTDASESTRPTSRRRDLEPLGYPPEWVDGPTFRKAICAFWNSTLSFRESNIYQEYQSRRLSDSESLVSVSSKNKDTPTVSMDQSGEQAAPRNMEDRMAGMEKLLERLATQLNVNASGKPRLPGTLGEPPTTANGRWNPADLGYFDPHLDKSYPESDIIAINKETWIRDVHLFVARVKDLVQLKGGQTVQNNLNTALRGAAQAWYIAELSELERSALRIDTSNQANLWCTALVKRFKEQPGVALSKLTNKKYTVKDARNRREPTEYVQTMIRYAEGASIEQVYNQLIFAHEQIVLELRFMVDPPIENTSVAQYIQALNIKKSSWFALHSHPSTAPTVQTRQQAYLPQQQGTRSQSSGFRSGNSPFRSSQQQQSPYWPQPTSVAFQRPFQQPSYQQRPQQFVPQSFSRNPFAPGVPYSPRQANAPATAATPPTRPYNNQLVPYNAHAAQGAPIVKQEMDQD